LTNTGKSARPPFGGFVKLYDLLALNTMSFLANTHCPHDTQALPLVEISGIFLLFSGHGTPDLPIISFSSALPIANV
jgi:hypothetical protein